MIDNIKRVNTLNGTLEKLDEEALNLMYLRLFGTPDGELVLQDMANRCFVYETTEGNGYNEGMRVMYLSIQTRLLNAVSKPGDTNAIQE